MSDDDYETDLYDYCGGCKRVKFHINFGDCDECGSDFKHKCGHGYYCYDCLDESIRFKTRKYITEERKLYFCNILCQTKYHSEKQKQIK